MSLTDNERKIVVDLELEKAQKTFRELDVLMNARMWNTAANRLYYALFHAVSALLINDGRAVKSHRGVLAQFGQYYVREGIFSRDDGRILSELVIMRDNADYNCFYEAAEENVQSYIAPVRDLIEKIRNYINP